MRDLRVTHKIPPLPQIPTSVPQTLEKQLEITKVIPTLVGPDDQQQVKPFVAFAVALITI